MSATGGIAAVHARIAGIESRLGVGTTGRDVRAEQAFEQLLTAATAAPTAAGSTLGASAPATVPGPAATSGTLASVPFGHLFESAGRRHGVAPELLAAVAKAESGYDPRAVSHAGAQGLMQLMPGTAKGLGVTDPFDPAQAVDGAARLLADNLRRFGSTELALAAYNAGPGAVSRHGGIPPYAETQAYVPKVIRHYEELLAR
ncbi:MAG TPA: lytic transglycosylase domain-containing protein [Acidimicrobiales bacterium]|nr:lytic transglycosylase domain-containing protein [Acidimicrobiales bacterium]